MAWLGQNPAAPRLRLRVVGPPLTQDDLAYDSELRAYLWDNGLQESIEFVGFVPQDHMPSLYRSTWLHINVSQTGSMDKTVLEALACGCPVLVGNEAFRDLLAGYPEFIIADDRPEAIGEQILDLYAKRDQVEPSDLRKLVIGRHDLPSYVQRLLQQLAEATVA
jgi:glycosyltransferase involved in cell wall biosynthesis